MAKRKKSQLAAQLFTLRDFQGSLKDIGKMLKKVRKIGYENVQISGPIAAADPIAVKTMMDDCGITAIGAHAGIGDFRTPKATAEIIDRLHAWNCSYVAIAYLAEEERRTLLHWKRRASEFTKIGKELAKEGITLQYHNHAFEFEKFGGKGAVGGRTGLEILYAESDKKYLQAELDTCWVARGGADPAAWCRSMKGRMHQVHLKDTVIKNNEPIFAEIGEGNINWKEVLKACKAAGVKDYIVEQDSCPTTNNPFKSLEISYKNLTKMGLK